MSSSSSKRQLVLICGSRDWPVFDKWAVRDRIAELSVHSTEVIHGGAPGADTWAGFWCRQLGVPVREFKAQWKLFGKKAGPIRNRQMLDEAPDLVIAFQKGRSRGTQDTIDEARRRGIPVEVHSPSAEHSGGVESVATTKSAPRRANDRGHGHQELESR